MVEQRLGAAEASNIFQVRPRGVIDDVSPAQLPPLPGRELGHQSVTRGWKGLAQRIRMRIGAD